jgi:hypothetical protein
MVRAAAENGREHRFMQYTYRSYTLRESTLMALDNDRDGPVACMVVAILASICLWLVSLKHYSCGWVDEYEG